MKNCVFSTRKAFYCPHVCQGSSMRVPRTGYPESPKSLPYVGKSSIRESTHMLDTNVITGCDEGQVTLTVVRYYLQQFLAQSSQTFGSFKLINLICGVMFRRVTNICLAHQLSRYCQGYKLNVRSHFLFYPNRSYLS